MRNRNSKGAGPTEFTDEDNNEDPDSSEQIPTAEHLAKSFLHEEGIKETEDLQYTLSSRPQAIQDSDILQASEVDEIDQGTGTALSIPRFLTTFLQGIVDRLQVTITNIQFTLRTQLQLNERNHFDQRQVSMSVITKVKEVIVDALSSTGNFRKSSQIIELS